MVARNPVKERKESLKIAKQLGLKPFQLNVVLSYLFMDIDAVVHFNPRVAQCEDERITKTFTVKMQEDGRFTIGSEVAKSTINGLVTKGIFEARDIGSGKYTLFEMVEIKRITKESEAALLQFLPTIISAPRISKEKLEVFAKHYNCLIIKDARVKAFRLEMLDGTKLIKPFLSERMYGKVCKISDIDVYQWVEVIEDTLKVNGVNLDGKESLLEQL